MTPDPGGTGGSMDPDETKDLVLTYWRSWQTSDWEGLRDCLADTFDMGGMPMDADEFTAMCESGTPWKDVELLSSVFDGDLGAIIYEGTDSKSGNRMRVSEHAKVVDGKITHITALIAPRDFNPGA